MKIRRLSKEGPWQVYAACTDRGDCPVADFLSHLGPGMEASAAGMLALLDRVAQHGPPRNVQLSHQLRGDIYEFIKGQIRILYFQDRERVVICTHGIIKKAQKVRNADIEHAEKAQQMYRAAKAANTLEIVEEANNG